MKWASRIEAFRKENGRLSLYKGGAENEFGTIFGIFLLRLVGEFSESREYYESNKRWLIKALEKNRREINTKSYSWKKYHQYLSFMMTLMIEFEQEHASEIGIEVEYSLSHNNIDDIIKKGSMGCNGYGNKSMFIAQFALYSEMQGNKQGKYVLEKWVEEHLKRINKFGMWGNKSKPYMMIQNSYHQCEILDYLGIIDEKKARRGAEFVISLQGKDSLWTPYPGGSPCYEYDSVYYVLRSKDSLVKHRNKIVNTLRAIEKMKGPDGLYCENRLLGANKGGKRLKILALGIKNERCNNGRIERLRWTTLARKKYTLNPTTQHWDKEIYDWDVDNLWACFFRVLTKKRIESEISGEKNYYLFKAPGIAHNMAQISNT